VHLARHAHRGAEGPRRLARPRLEVEPDAVEREAEVARRRAQRRLEALRRQRILAA